MSHFIHAHPELGYEEFESSAAVAALAEQYGFTVERDAAGLPTAFRATTGSGDLHVVYCAEFDALPDVGHACGHNIIAATSLGAAIGLAAVADEIGVARHPARHTIRGGWRRQDRPAERRLLRRRARGARWCTRPQSIVWNANCLAVDHFEVTFTGKEAHASVAPWEGLNALDALTISQVALALLRQQLRPE